VFEAKLVFSTEECPPAWFADRAGWRAENREHGGQSESDHGLLFADH
jgi:hypothetical protein